MVDHLPPPKPAIVEEDKTPKQDIRERINAVRASFALIRERAQQSGEAPGGVQVAQDFNQALPFQNFNQFSNFNDFSNFNQFSNFNNFNNG